MKNKIEEQIRQELEYVLSEINIQGEIDKLTDPKKIKEQIKREIDSVIAQKVSDAIEKAIFEGVRKNQPLIDAYTADKVQSLMYAVEEATK